MSRGKLFLTSANDLFVFLLICLSASTKQSSTAVTSTSVVLRPAPKLIEAAADAKIAQLREELKIFERDAAEVKTLIVEENKIALQSKRRRLEDMMKDEEASINELVNIEIQHIRRKADQEIMLTRQKTDEELLITRRRLDIENEDSLARIDERIRLKAASIQAAIAALKS